MDAPQRRRRAAFPPRHTPSIWTPRFLGVIWALIWSALLAAGCTSTPPRPQSGLEASERFVIDRAPAAFDARTPQDLPVVVFEGGSLRWSDLQNHLAEASGSEIAEQLILDSLLTQACAGAGITITQEAIHDEEQRLVRTLGGNAADSAPSAEQSQAALEQVRAARGLGPVRYQAFLKRNAMLRTLVQDNVRVRSAAVEQTYELRYSERWDVRLITVAGRTDANRVLNALNAGEPFDRAAMRWSTDVSAPRGGLVTGVSVHDQQLPQAMRSALAQLSVGERVGPIDIGSSFLFMQTVERREPVSKPAFAEVQLELEQAVHARQERLLMDELAQNLLSSAQIELRDQHLAWSWGERPTAQ